MNIVSKHIKPHEKDRLKRKMQLVNKESKNPNIERVNSMIDRLNEIEDLAQEFRRKKQLEKSIDKILFFKDNAGSKINATVKSSSIHDTNDKNLRVDEKRDLYGRNKAIKKPWLIRNEG